MGNEVQSMYKQMDHPQNVGHFFCLLDIAAFMNPRDFKARIDQTIDRIKACRKQPEVDEILVPGEATHRRRNTTGNTASRSTRRRSTNCMIYVMNMVSYTDSVRSRPFSRPRHRPPSIACPTRCPMVC